MGGKNPLTQQINLIVSALFLGSFTLLTIVILLEALDEDNPVANMMAAHAQQAVMEEF